MAFTGIVKEARVFVGQPSQFYMKFGGNAPLDLQPILVHMQVEDGMGHTASGMASSWITPWFGNIADDFSAAYQNAVAEIIRDGASAYDASPVHPIAAAHEMDKSLDRRAAELNVTRLAGRSAIALFEHAFADGLGKAMNVNTMEAILHRSSGTNLSEIHSELGSFDLSSFPGVPGQYSLKTRHTVGENDYLRESQIQSGDHVNENVPASLEKQIETYALRDFKIKISGKEDVSKSIDRLKQIAHLLDEKIGSENYTITLDSNQTFGPSESEGDRQEMYSRIETFFQTLHEQAQGDAKLDRFFKSVEYHEQPFTSATLYEFTADDKQHIHRLQTHPNYGVPWLIDESMDRENAVHTAFELGIMGFGYKGCKGLGLGIADSALVEVRNAGRDPTYFRTFEDLSLVGPSDLQTEHAVIMRLGGAPNQERNGVFKVGGGFPHYTQAEKNGIAAAMSDQYTLTPKGLYIRTEGNRFSVKGLNGPGLFPAFAMQLDNSEVRTEITKR